MSRARSTGPASAESALATCTASAARGSDRAAAAALALTRKGAARSVPAASACSSRAAVRAGGDAATPGPRAFSRAAFSFSRDSRRDSASARAARKSLRSRGSDFPTLSARLVAEAARRFASLSIAERSFSDGVFIAPSFAQVGGG